MNLLQTLSVVAHHNAFPGMGYKRASKLSNLKPTVMRSALQAYKEGHIAAVVFGVITDNRVINMLHGLPLKVAQTISRIETKLRCHLTRSRLAKLVAWYWIGQLEKDLDGVSLIPEFA